MAVFLKGNRLNSQLEILIEEARETLILISPYIKLHERFKDALRKNKENDKLEIRIVFGKNENDISKSISLDDLRFLMEFPNIEIRHEKRLHAKYYANEKIAILTSMNLYDSSQNNNIEVGVMTKIKTFGEEVLDTDAADYFYDVIENSDLLFDKIPNYKSGILGVGKVYESSTIEIDKISILLNIIRVGFCIRTGKEIPFNWKHPFCIEAEKEWGMNPNENLPEKFCHFSGEESEGNTSKKFPILKKNWVKAKSVHKF